MSVLPDLAMRSLDAAWNRARWESLPDDGNRYEVIDGVLYKVYLAQRVPPVDRRSDLLAAPQSGGYTRCRYHLSGTARRVHARMRSGTTRFAQSTHFGPADELVSPTLPVRSPVASLFAHAPSTAL